MARTKKSIRLYPSPFSLDYWRDAASELKDTKMLVITALMIALRIALKPFAIPLGPQLKIQPAMLATALGSMIFGPVVAIPAAVVSDTVGFMLFPQGDYFLPFMLTEIASTVIYALCLYRSDVTPIRVMISRFLICSVVNVLIQQPILAWQYTYLGYPAKAKEAMLGITFLLRIFKNIACFPFEAIVLTLFLKVLLPVTNRMRLTFCKDANLTFEKKHTVALVGLLLAGIVLFTSYLGYRYQGTSRTADYSDKARVENNQASAALMLEKTDDWDTETVVCVVDSAFRPLFGKETDYTVSVYILDKAAFAAGQAAEAEKGKIYDMDTLWGYSKSGPKNDPYKSLIKVAEATFTKHEKTGEVTDFLIKLIK